MRRPKHRIVALGLAAALTVAFVGATTASAQGKGRPGVSAKEIRVGGLASPPNDTLRVEYPDGFDGVKAYFDLINKKGGVFGRKLKLVAQLSDQGQPSANIQAIRSLVEEKKVFAVLPIMTNSFTLGGKYLADKGVPAFGINVDPAWCGSSDEQAAVERAEIDEGRLTQCPRSNLFGEKGSYLCFECASIGPSYVAQELGLKKAALFTYTHVSSAKCAKGTRAGFEQYGIDVVHENTSLEFGFSVSQVAADVQAMKDAGVQFVATCTEFGGAFKISQALKQAGVEDVVFYAPEGYKESTAEEFGDELDNWYFRLGFVPWQAKGLPKGTRQFLKAMKKRGVEPSEHSQAGWINANLLVDGIKAAGEDFTQESVVDAINAMTDFTANGMLPPLAWTPTPPPGVDGGHGPAHQACDAYVEVVDGKFEPRFGKPGQPFVCWPINPPPPDAAAIMEPYYQPLKPGETVPTAAG